MASMKLVMEPIVLGSVVPNFECETSMGPINFHSFLGNSWVILFSHPADYTPVCTTELSTVCSLVESEFKEIGVKAIALSCDNVESHKNWIHDIDAYSLNVRGCDVKMNFPIIADEDRSIARQFNMLPASGELDDPTSGLPMMILQVVYLKKLLYCC